MTERQLHLVTLLAIVYTVSWIAVARPSPPADAPAVAAAAPATPVPPGWRVQTPIERTVGAPAPRPVRVPARRPRTRSS